MGSKHISIRDDVYKKLEARKLPNESFSDIIEKLLQENTNPFECMGLWKDIEHIEEITEVIQENKKINKKKTEQLFTQFEK